MLPTTMAIILNATVKEKKDRERISFLFVYEYIKREEQF